MGAGAKTGSRTTALVTLFFVAGAFTGSGWITTGAAVSGSGGGVITAAAVTAGSAAMITLRCDWTYDTPVYTPVAASAPPRNPRRIFVFIARSSLLIVKRVSRRGSFSACNLMRLK